MFSGVNNYNQYSTESSQQQGDNVRRGDETMTKARRSAPFTRLYTCMAEDV